MPTFDQQEKSREDGQPITLFFVRYGSANANYYSYTDGEEEVTYGVVGGVAVVYKPIPIKHGSIQRSLILDAQRMTLTAPDSIPLATRWRTYPPSEVISMTVRQGHADNNEFPVVWIGRILGHKDLGSGECEFACEPRHTSLGRTGLSRNYQYPCPHLLYSQGAGLCNANKAAHTFEHPVSAINGPEITLGAAWNALTEAARSKFLTGLIEWTTDDGRVEVRSIYRIATDTKKITMAGPPIQLTVGMTVRMVRGCNHQAYAPAGDCEAVFNNVVNFGGDPTIPLVNPVGIKNIFN